MSIEIKAPTFPESIADGTLVTWHKKPGEAVSRDELLADIETDKVVLEVISPSDGQIEKALKDEGDTVMSEEPIATFAEGKVATPSSQPSEAMAAASEKTVEDKVQPLTTHFSPAARRLAEEQNLLAQPIKGTGKSGLITKEDVLNFINHTSAPEPATASAPAVTTTTAPLAMDDGDRTEKRVPMSRLRSRVAERLLAAQHEAAMLTTFNEINMQPVMDLRKQYKDLFEKTHQARLGFMSFFVKAAIEALRRFPDVNASIDGNDMVYHGYFDIGVAVSSNRGLVVPVLRDADRMSMAQIETQIRAFGDKAKSGKLTIEEMTGGTFTITNGGVFGSLMSTPILNPPQTGILGMHKIQERPMAVNGDVKILPMMYVALSYDHRMIDGKSAVQFLVTMKELLEDPARILLEI